MSKTFEQVFAEVNQIFREVLSLPDLQLKYETKAGDVPEWDSLNHIELVIAIEKHFQIRFNFSELQKFKNVGEMCDNIVGKLGAAK